MFNRLPVTGNMTVTLLRPFLHILFKYLKEGFADISLNSSHMLLPIRSEPLSPKLIFTKSFNKKILTVKVYDINRNFNMLN